MINRHRVLVDKSALQDVDTNPVVMLPTGWQVHMLDRCRVDSVPGWVMATDNDRFSAIDKQRWRTHCLLPMKRGCAMDSVRCRHRRWPPATRANIGHPHWPHASDWWLAINTLLHRLIWMYGHRVRMCEFVAMNRDVPANGSIAISCTCGTHWSANTIRTDCLVGVLSILLWLEMEGVRCRRGGNDLLWCCNGECRAFWATSNGLRGRSEELACDELDGRPGDTLILSWNMTVIHQSYSITFNTIEHLCYLCTTLR